MSKQLYSDQCMENDERQGNSTDLQEPCTKTTEQKELKISQVKEESAEFCESPDEDHVKENLPETMCNSSAEFDDFNNTTDGKASDQQESFTSPDLNNLKMVLKKRAFSLPEDISFDKLDCCDIICPSAKRTRQQEVIYTDAHNYNNENIPPEKTSQRKTNLQKASEILCRNNLMQVTLRTIALIKRNQQLQKELDKLKIEVAQFLQSVVSNPESNFSQRKENQ